jgi:hypothetical protein
MSCRRQEMGKDRFASPIAFTARLIWFGLPLTTGR